MTAQRSRWGLLALAFVAVGWKVLQDAIGGDDGASQPIARLMDLCRPKKHTDRVPGLFGISVLYRQLLGRNRGRAASFNGGREASGL